MEAFFSGWRVVLVFCEVIMASDIRHIHGQESAGGDIGIDFRYHATAGAISLCDFVALPFPYDWSIPIRFLPERCFEGFCLCLTLWRSRFPIVRDHRLPVLVCSENEVLSKYMVRDDHSVERIEELWGEFFLLFMFPVLHDDDVIMRLHFFEQCQIRLQFDRISILLVENPFLGFELEIVQILDICTIEIGVPRFTTYIEQ